MVRRRVRVGLGVLGAVVGLCVLAAVLLPLLVPREKLRTMAETQVREKTGGELSLGDISLRVFPRLRLVLGASTLAVTQEGLRGAGQDPGPLLAADVALQRLEVDLALWPLLRKQLEFGQVSLIAPRVDLTTAAPDTAPETDEATPPAPAPAPPPALGLALAAVAVRDGELLWREDGTGRAVTVHGWQQDLSAPDLGLLVARLQRLGGADLPADPSPATARLALDTRVAAIELAGFGATPPPPLRDLRLRADLSVPPAVVGGELAIDELSLPGWLVTAHAVLQHERVEIDRLDLKGGEAVTLAGTASFAPPPAVGPLRADLTGAVDLAGILAQIEPWLPPRPAGQPPLPTFTGTLQVAVTVDLAAPPSLADAAAWTAAREQGLAGRAELRASGGPLTVTTAQLAEPLRIQRVALTSDLRTPVNLTRLEATGAEVSAGRVDLQATFAPPPAAGPLAADLRGKVDLATLMALVSPFLPPRPADAAPLPALTGALDVALAANLPAAPSLADTAAWAAAWRAGLPGKAELRANGGPVTVASPQLGEPLQIKTVALVSDLRSRSGRSRLTANGVAHALVQGDATVELVPVGANGAAQVDLALGRLDLDALAALAKEQKSAAGDQQTRTGFSLIDRAWAEPAARPLPGELIPPDLAADVTATVRELVFLKTVYTDVKLSGTLRERVIDVPSLTARLGTGTVAGQARVDYATDPGGRATWDATVTKAPANLLLKPYVPLLADVWTGELTAQAAGGCDLLDPAAILKSLTLAGEITGNQGLIDLQQPLSGVRQYLGDRTDLLRVQYAAAREHFEVRDGKVHLENLSIDGKDTDWTGQGWIGLDGKLDLNLQVRLPAGFTPQLGDLSFVADALRDKDGRIGLDFTLTGDSRSPTVGLNLDPAALMKSDAVKKEVEEGVKKGMGGLLDRLKGK